MSYRDFSKGFVDYVKMVSDYLAGVAPWKDPAIPTDSSTEVEGYRSFSLSRHQITMASAINLQAAHQRCSKERDKTPEDYMREFRDEIAFDGETVDSFAPLVESELVDIKERFPKIRERLNREEPKLMDRYNSYDAHEVGEM